MKKGMVSLSATKMKSKPSLGYMQPHQPPVPGKSKKSPRISNNHNLSPDKLSTKKSKKPKKKEIPYEDFLTKTLLEGTLGQNTRCLK